MTKEIELAAEAGAKARYPQTEDMTFSDIVHSDTDRLITKRVSRIAHNGWQPAILGINTLMLPQLNMGNMKCFVREQISNITKHGTIPDGLITTKI